MYCLSNTVEDLIKFVFISILHSVRGGFYWIFSPVSLVFTKYAIVMVKWLSTGTIQSTEFQQNFGDTFVKFTSTEKYDHFI